MKENGGGSGIMKNKFDYSKYKCPYSYLEKECGHELQGPAGYEDTYSVWCKCGYRGPVFYLDPEDLGLEKIEETEQVGQTKTGLMPFQLSRQHREYLLREKFRHEQDIKTLESDFYAYYEMAKKFRYPATDIAKRREVFERKVDRLISRITVIEETLYEMDQYVFMDRYPGI